VFDTDVVQRVYAVREISALLKELIESSAPLSSVWVAGEVSNVSRPSSGHVYFTLKDQNAQLRAVFFASRYVRTSTARLIEAGHAIVAHGRVSLYETRGDLQLVVDFVQPEGAGALQLEFERLRAKLDAEGLFEAARKRPLPSFPRCIGVVTSPSGAVFHDIQRVVERRWPLAQLMLAPAPVQGPEAAPAIAEALAALSARDDVDVIILARGGGALEELSAFNDERVARAVFGSTHPVVSAIGHETDVTIADYVADHRAPTPSAAAELVTPDRSQLAQAVALAAGRCEAALAAAVAARRRDIALARQRLTRGVPDVDFWRQRVDDRIRRGFELVEREHEGRVHRTGTCVWRLKALDPYATLDRGYAIVQLGAHVVTSVRDPRRGDRLDIRVKDGTFQAVAGDASAVRAARKRKPIAGPQAPLFTMPEERV